MTNLHAQHSKGWAGLSFIVLLIVASFAGGIPPLATADNAAVAAYFAAHRQGILISSWLTLPLGAFFLWFTVGLAGFLRRTSAVDDGLPTYTLAAGIYASAMAWLGGALMTAMAFAPRGTALSFPWALAQYINGPFLSMALAIFIFAVAHSMRRHGSAPAWMTWLGYATALLEVLASFGVFSSTAMAAGSPVIALGSLLLFIIWMVAVSLHLIRAAAGQEQAGAVSPSI